MSETPPGRNERQPMEPNRIRPQPVSGPPSSHADGASMLKVSQDGRYFVRDGAPFFWMGDTVWSLVNRYTPD